MLFLSCFFALLAGVVAPWTRAEGTSEPPAARPAAGASLGRELTDRLGHDAAGTPRVKDVSFDGDVLTVRYRIKDLPTPDMQRVSAIADAREVLTATSVSTISPDKVVIEAVLPEKPVDATPDLTARFDGEVAEQIDQSTTRVEQVEAAAEKLTTTLDSPAPAPTTAHVTKKNP